MVIGTRTGADGGPDADAGQPVAVLEVTLDDVTGEQLAHTVGELLGAGAHDAWLSPVLMKKGRPGHVVHVLCDPADVRTLRRLLRTETGSPGVRMTVAERWPAARRVGTVVIDGQPIRVKATAARAKAEHDDVAAAARRTGRPLRDVAARAEAGLGGTATPASRRYRTVRGSAPPGRDRSGAGTGVEEDGVEEDGAQDDRAQEDGVEDDGDAPA